MISILIISLVVLAVAFIVAALNMGVHVKKMFNRDPFSNDNPIDSFGKMFMNHIVCMIFMALGGIGALVSGITLIVRAFSH